MIGRSRSWTTLSQADGDIAVSVDLDLFDRREKVGVDGLLIKGN